MLKEINFDKVVDERIGKIRFILSRKAKEYASEESRFHNFNIAARLLDITPEDALMGMMMKHLVSVLDLVEWAETSPERLNYPIIDEKIGDLINYLILLEGMLKNRVNHIVAGEE